MENYCSGQVSSACRYEAEKKEVGGGGAAALCVASVINNPIFLDQNGDGELSEATSASS